RFVGAAIVTPPPEGTPDADVAVVSVTDALSAQARPYDREFIDAMVPLLQPEVEMAQIALSRAQHRELRNLAQEIIDADSTQIGDMQLYRRTWFGSRDRKSVV